VHTSPYGGTGVSNDTVVEVYSDLNMANLLYSNDDYGGSRFSKVVMTMTAGTTYYIKLRHYDTSSELHADLKVTKNIPAISISQNNPRNVEVAELEFAVFSAAVPSGAGGQYLVYSGFYNASWHADGRDGVIEVYRDEALTDRIVSSTYERDTFSQVSVNMESGKTYYITFAGYLGKYAKGRVYLSEMAVGAVSDLNYNNNTKPMLGYGNTLRFKVNGGPLLNYYVAPSLSWDGVNFYDKSENMTFVSFSEVGTKEFAINGINLTSGGNGVLYTKLKAFNTNLSTRLLLWESDVLVEGRSERALSDLSFAKTTHVPSMFNGADVQGKFTMIHNPETIVDDDIIQYRDPSGVKQNTLIYKDTNVIGYNTIAASH
jgi:hypothetical protein